MTLVEAAHARIAHARAELNSANAFLRLVSLPEMRPEAKAAVEFVADRYALSVVDLVGPARVARIAEPRFVAMYLMRYIHGIPPAEIGFCFRRDRTTVEQALQTVSDRRQTEKKFRADLSALVTAYTPLPVSPTQHTDHAPETTTIPAGGTPSANARSDHP